jgi:hypothetical protein
LELSLERRMLLSRAVDIQRGEKPKLGAVVNGMSERNEFNRGRYAVEPANADSGAIRRPRSDRTLP